MVVNLPSMTRNLQSSDLAKKGLFLGVGFGVVGLWGWVGGLIDGLLYNKEKTSGI